MEMEIQYEHNTTLNRRKFLWFCVTYLTTSHRNGTIIIISASQEIKKKCVSLCYKYIIPGTATIDLPTTQFFICLS